MYSGGMYALFFLWKFIRAVLCCTVYQSEAHLYEQFLIIIMHTFLYRHYFRGGSHELRPVGVFSYLGSVSYVSPV